jgi:hypothetical protein
LFPEIEFRLNNGLEIRHDRKEIMNKNFFVGDLMIPRQIGKLHSLPDPESVNLPIKYIPLAKPGTEYFGFDVNVLNTAARFVASNSICESRLNDAGATDSLNDSEAADGKNDKVMNADGLNNLNVVLMVENLLLKASAWFNRNVQYEQ